MKMVKFEMEDGIDIYINPDQVKYVVPSWNNGKEISKIVMDKSSVYVKQQAVWVAMRLENMSTP